MVSEIKPMLFEGAISEAEAVSLLGNDAYYMQQKVDGHRVLVFVSKGQVSGRSRQGLPYTISREAAKSLLSLGVDNMVLDGEWVEGSLVVFDMLVLDGADLRDLPYAARLFKLEETFAGGPSAGKIELPSVCVIQTCKDQWAKEAGYRILRDRGAEGVVFKRADSIYRAGRCGVSGVWRRRKWTASASLRVLAHHATKHSVHVALADGNELGTVTIPAAKKLPPVGATIEVHYLYAHRGGGLSQPAFKGIRSDVGPDTAEALQYKGEMR